MSVEQLKKFYQQVSEDEDLQSEFEGLETMEDVMEKTVALGAEHGFEFSAEDVKTVMEQASTQAEELDEAELDDVAGGAGGWQITNKQACRFRKPKKPGFWEHG